MNLCNTMMIQIEMNRENQMKTEVKPYVEMNELQV